MLLFGEKTNKIKNNWGEKIIVIVRTRRRRSKCRKRSFKDRLPGTFCCSNVFWQDIKMFVVVKCQIKTSGHFLFAVLTCWWNICPGQEHHHIAALTISRILIFQLLFDELEDLDERIRTFKADAKSENTSVKVSVCLHVQRW